MITVATIRGTSFASIITRSSRGGPAFTVAFGYFHGDEFNCTRASRDYKSEAGARRAANAFANK